jgi:hypothetical protein
MNEHFCSLDKFIYTSCHLRHLLGSFLKGDINASFPIKSTTHNHAVIVTKSLMAKRYNCSFKSHDIEGIRWADPYRYFMPVSLVVITDNTYSISLLGCSLETSLGLLDLIFCGIKMDWSWDKFDSVIYSPRLGCIVTVTMNYLFTLSCPSSLSQIQQQRGMDRRHLKI